jgi:hypothetical protein
MGASMGGAHKLGNDISDRGLSMSGVFLVRPFGGITFYLEKLIHGSVLSARIIEAAPARGKSFLFGRTRDT